MSSKVEFVNRGTVGYTGAIPSSSTLLINTKGSSRRQAAADLVDGDTKAQLCLARSDIHFSSE